MKRRVVRFASAMPFERVSELFEREYGILISSSWIQSLTDEVGEVSESELITLIPDNKPISSSDIHIVQTDGAFIPMTKGWEEAKTVVIGKLDNQKQTNPQIIDKFFYAAKSDVSLFENNLHTILSKRRIRDGTVIVMGDGAKWIWNMYKRLFRKRIEILDFYHVSEYIHEAMKLIFGEDSPIGKEKSEYFCHTVKHSDNGGDILIEYIKQNINNPSLREYKKRLQTIMTYFSTNKDRMHYQTYMEKGFPIGTGLVESTQKWLIQSRLKQSGMHWSKKGSKQMVSLQVMMANRMYNSWFNKRFAA